MKDRRFRYVYQSSISKNILILHFDINEIEEGLSGKFVPAYELISRDLPVGIPDKNGKSIYENDIIRILYTDWWSKASDDTRTLEQYKKDISCVGKVVYEYDSFVLEFSDKTKGSIFEGTHGEKEIVGNIYENSELIKYAERI